MDASRIAHDLSLRRQGGGYHGACPSCGYPSGFTVEQKQGRTLVRCHAGGCEQSAVIDALRRLNLWSGEPDSDHPAPFPRDETNAARKAGTMRDAARSIWGKTVPAEGTAAESYLRCRSITMPIPSTIRFLAACRHTGTGMLLPAMISAVSVVPSQDIVAIHRTYLTLDGRKCPVTDPKKTLGPVAGGAVNLAPAGPVLIIAEGIETTMSAMQATGLPAWAALSAGGVRALILPPLPLAAEIIIAADNDETGVGQAAARDAAARWVAEGRRVRVALPPTAGTDFNDLIRGAA